MLVGSQIPLLWCLNWNRAFSAADVRALLFGIAAFSCIPRVKCRAVFLSLLLCCKSHAQNSSLEEISSFSRTLVHLVWLPLSKDPPAVAPVLNEAWQRRGDLRIGLADEPGLVPEVGVVP